ncbi:MAG TPA: prephenate dehydratase [Solirubrobacterales bacterium]|nr:prephenate dehydratase [Solirubrobacterales bacterium]
MPLSVAFLGPAGTFSDDALRAVDGRALGGVEPRPARTIHDAVMAVARGEADRALVPFENSIEGSVRPTLDALAFDAERVSIAGEHDHAISCALIARSEIGLDEVEVVVSHPQPSAQCARFLRESLPGAEVRGTDSTAEAVRLVSESEGRWAALGAASAAEIYGCVVLRRGVEDEPGNVTRFAWLAPEGVRAEETDAEWRTTLIFSELGADHPGALVDALYEISNREVNMTRIESRPRRYELGRYMFFIDVEGADTDPAVAEAIGALRNKAENVRVLGSYPVTGPLP